MISLLGRILGVVLIVMLAGCAAPGQRFAGIASPVKGQGDVYLYRTKAFFAMGQAFEVSLDGKKVGDLYNASYLHLRLNAGRHSLKVSPGGLAQSSDLSIQVESSKPAFYQYDFASGPLANVFFVGSSIQPRTQERALLDLAELNSAK